METKKNVLLTGASGAIGKATALELAKHKYHVVLLARSKQKIDTLADEINQADGDGSASAYQLDVADIKSTRDTLTEIINTHGAVYGVVNNAGTIDPIASIDHADPIEFANCFNTNLIGAWNVAACCLTSMTQAKTGVIINISSGAADKVLEGWAAYCSSKAALKVITKFINFEYNDKGIQAYGFRPGLVLSAMQEKIRASGMNPVSQLPIEELQPPELAASGIVWLINNRPTKWSNPESSEVDIRDPEFLSASGL